MTKNNHLIIILMSISMVTWGVAWTSAKIVNTYLDYNSLVFLRFLIGFITIIPFLYFRKINFFKVPISSYINISITSLLFFLYNQCFFIGTNIGDPGKGGVFVTTTNPIITFIIIVLIKRHVNYFKLIAIIIGIIGGLCTLNIFNIGLNAFVFKGNQYFIFCSISWGIMSIIMANGQKNMDSIWYIAFCYALTAIIALFFADINTILKISNYDFIFYINFAVVVIAMSFGTSIYIIATHKLGPVIASTFIFSVPFIAMGTAYLFLNEPLGINVVIGGMLSLVSIYLINNVPLNIKS